MNTIIGYCYLLDTMLTACRSRRIALSKPHATQIPGCAYACYTYRFKFSPCAPAGLWQRERRSHGNVSFCPTPVGLCPRWLLSYGLLSGYQRKHDERHTDYRNKKTHSLHKSTHSQRENFQSNFWNNEAVTVWSPVRQSISTSVHAAPNVAYAYMFPVSKSVLYRHIQAAVSKTRYIQLVKVGKVLSSTDRRWSLDSSAFIGHYLNLEHGHGASASCCVSVSPRATGVCTRVWGQKVCWRFRIHTYMGN